MRVTRSNGHVHIDLPIAAGRFLLQELLDVKGGSKLPKVKQLCKELEAAFALGPVLNEQDRAR